MPLFIVSLPALMEKIKINDKTFTPYLRNNRIQAEIQRLASEINERHRGKKIAFLPVLSGSFLFFSDLVKHIELDFEVHFVKYKSYMGTDTTGKVQKLLSPPANLKNRVAVIVEDIVDTGNTLKSIIPDVENAQPDGVQICTLLSKPEKYDAFYPVDFIGFEIENDFVVGYGLDYDEAGRGLQHIYKLSNN